MSNISDWDEHRLAQFIEHTFLQHPPRFDTLLTDKLYAAHIYKDYRGVADSTKYPSADGKWTVPPGTGGGGGGPPSGAAGGELGGTYPNPSLAATGVVAGTYGDNNNIPVVTVNVGGRISSIHVAPNYYFNILAYGAVGNGVTDNITAINNAITACSAAGGGVVFIPQGTFVYSASFSLPAKVSLWGTGPASILKPTTTTSSAVAVGGEGVTLADFKLTCPAALVRNDADISSGILITTGSSNVNVSRVIVDTVAASAFTVTGQATNVVIHACLATNCFGDGYHITDGSTNITVSDSFAIATGDDSFAAVSNGTDPAPTSWVRFINCYSVNCGVNGFSSLGGQNLQIIGGAVSNAGKAAAYIASATGNSSMTCQNVIIDGLMADTLAQYGIFVGGYAGHITTHIKIANTTISNMNAGNTASIYIDGFVKDVEVVNVSAIVSANNGILVGGATSSSSPPQDIRIKGCLIDSPQGWGIYADYCQGVLDIDGITFKNIDTANVAASVVQLTANCTASPIRLSRCSHIDESGSVANLAKFLNNLSGKPVFSYGNFSATNKSVDGPTVGSNGGTGTVATAVDTYIAGSSLPITGIIKAGTTFRWRFSLTKSAAGTVAPIWNVRFGTAGTTADTARLVFTSALLQTAVVDTGWFDIEVVIGSVSATGTVTGAMRMAHKLSTTGLQTVAQDQLFTTTSAAFDLTVANLKVGVSVVPGTSGVFTFQTVSAQVVNPT